ncbi:DUF1033 family protein [Streptococcus merionis]|uniref:DUF1033 family protein n=1 Tax=Streptococcus merionis TaxID=400065 RepID=UPI0035140596
MYQVIKLFGDVEPWWFLDGWEENIVACESFDSYPEAVQFYQSQWAKLAKQFPQKEEKSDQMVAFWNPKEQRWCEECGESLQQFHSLFILSESETVIPLSKAHLEQSAKRFSCRLRKKA